MARNPRPPRGRSGAVRQVTLAMAGIICRKPHHPQPSFRSNLSLSPGTPEVQELEVQEVRRAGRLHRAARAPRCTHPVSVLTPGKFGKFTCQPPSVRTDLEALDPLERPNSPSPCARGRGPGALWAWRGGGWGEGSQAVVVRAVRDWGQGVTRASPETRGPRRRRQSHRDGRARRDESCPSGWLVDHSNLPRWRGVPLPDQRARPAGR